MRNTFIDSLQSQAREDPRIFLVVGDLGFSVVENFAKEFPDRFLNAGIAEQNMAGIAAGLAIEGYHVFVYSIANFPLVRCLEQIRNDICYHNLSVTIVSVGGGLSYGNLGYSHHATEDFSLTIPLPNLRIFAPGDPLEVRSVMKSIYSYHGPSYLRLGKAGEKIFHKCEPIINSGELVEVSEGRKVLLITVGGVMDLGFEIKELLESHNIDAAISSFPELSPLSYKSFCSIEERFELAVVLEEHRIGGAYSYISDCLHLHEIHSGRKNRIFLMPLRIDLPPPASSGSLKFLRSKLNLSPDLCLQRILEIMNTIKQPNCS